MVKVTIDLAGVEAKLGADSMRNGRRAFANQALADMNPFVPFKEGPLRQATSIAMDGSQIDYHMPYAKRQFYVQHSNYTTPKTGPRWDEKAKGLHISDWEKAFIGGTRL